MYSLKCNGYNFTFYNSLVIRNQNNILRSYNNVNLRMKRYIIKLFKLGSAKAYFPVSCHLSVKYITFSNKIRNKCIFRLIIYFFRSSCLLNHTISHYNNLIGHSKRFFLVMRNVYKRYSKAFMH